MKGMHVKHPVRITLIAAATITLAACGSSTHTHHLNVHATPTSSTVLQAGADTRQLIAHCVNGDLSTAHLVTLVTSHGGLKKVAACLNIHNRKAFERAVRDSAVTWAEAGGFASKPGRAAWLTSRNTLVTGAGVQVPSLFQIVESFQ